ncbi:16S rRNA (adenine(1518)-N(6)/adenine(1519)-N(6))-dimethyltransferase RsmA [Patescibacteria group bacterium]|nr:16S rRNA (adenine(1518)-N(6)/adenine(1519)-N(6))-dimethyltransferase RsmA [Patescibacteria group bacterium]
MEFKPKKYLGQNFLIDKNILRKIIDAADLSAKDIILEIGPGTGVLTLELAKYAKKVIAVEKDRELCAMLKENLKNYKNVEIINANILKIENLKLKIDKIVANLPYYITSPVIRKFLEADPPAGGQPREMILMVQKEVAQRICAKPPNMNLLAVAVQFYAEPKIICYVSKNSFWPKPKVDSSIIKIVPHVGRRTSHIKIGMIFNLVKMGFSSKRKMLKNNLKIEESTFKKLGLNPKTRAENLSIENWIKLYEEIYEK